DLGGAGCRGSDRRRVLAGGEFARHRPAADASEGLRALPRARGEGRDQCADRRAQALQGADQVGRRERGRIDGGWGGYPCSLPRRPQGETGADGCADRAPSGNRGQQRTRGSLEARVMEQAIAIPRMELLQVADAVAREKSIDRDEVLSAMEQAIQKAGRSKYGHEHDIRATIDRKTGEIQLMRYLQVADPVENEFTQISLAAAQKVKKDVTVGEFLVDT